MELNLTALMFIDPETKWFEIAQFLDNHKISVHILKMRNKV